MTGHEQRDQAAAYALGALDAEERAAFEAHLAGCASCQAEVLAYRETAAALASAAPGAPAPSPALRDRVLAEARRVRPLRPGRASRWPLAAAASLVLAVLLGAGWWREWAGREELAARVTQQDELLATLLAPGARVADLAASGRPPSARLFWDARRQRVVIAVFNLPPAPAGRTYQLWAIAKGESPVSVGTFNTSADGRLTTVLAAPAGRVFDLTAVTEEPAGGSPQPTQTPFLVGPLQRSE